MVKIFLKIFFDGAMSFKILLVTIGEKFTSESLMILKKLRNMARTVGPLLRLRLSHTLNRLLPQQCICHSTNQQQSKISQQKKSDLKQEAKSAKTSFHYSTSMKERLKNTDWAD